MLIYNKTSSYKIETCLIHLKKDAWFSFLIAILKVAFITIAWTKGTEIYSTWLGTLVTRVTCTVFVVAWICVPVT